MNRRNLIIGSAATAVAPLEALAISQPVLALPPTHGNRKIEVSVSDFGGIGIPRTRSVYARVKLLGEAAFEPVEEYKRKYRYTTCGWGASKLAQNTPRFFWIGDLNIDEHFRECERLDEQGVKEAIKCEAIHHIENFFGLAPSDHWRSEARHPFFSLYADLKEQHEL